MDVLVGAGLDFLKGMIAEPGREPVVHIEFHISSMLNSRKLDLLGEQIAMIDRIGASGQATSSKAW